MKRRQRTLTSPSPQHEQARLLGLLRDEDFATGFRITRALRSEANTDFLFGRNELALQHFHRWVNRLVDDDDVG